MVEVAEAGELPTQPDRSQARGIGDVVVADVVDLEAARAGAAQQHVGGGATEEAAETDDLPIGPALAERIAREDRVVADIVDLVLAGRGRTVRAAQNHVGGGGGGGARGMAGGTHGDPGA